MCRTVHAVLSTVICGIQMLVRVFMTLILMIENVIRMLLQTLYNFISFVLQMISLIPICLVFLLTSRLKCLFCGGGGGCPGNRGGAADCLMSFLAILIIFFIFRATGVLDKLFYTLGYTKYGASLTSLTMRTVTADARFVPTPGESAFCSRNDSGGPPKELREFIDKFGASPRMNLVSAPETTTWTDTDTGTTYTVAETRNNNYTTVMYYLV